MSAILKEEAQRFGKLFISYTKIIVGGMLFATLFFFIFAGVKANYVSLEILAAVLATLSIGFSAIFAYLSFRAFGKNEFESVRLALKIMELEELKKAYQLEVSENQMEAVSQRIAQEVMNLSSSQLEVFNKQDYSYQLWTYSTSRLIVFIITGAIRTFMYPGTGGLLRKPEKDEVQKHVAG
jgi:hypothetical protein